MLSIEAATSESGLALFGALSAFSPEMTVSDERERCFVSVELGDDEKAQDVFDALHEVVGSRKGGSPLITTLEVSGSAPSYASVTSLPPHG